MSWAGRVAKRKYRNEPTTLDGITFYSKREAGYYAVLKLREKAGEVSAVELQRPFSLMTGSGQVVGIYKSDFAFWDHVQDKFRVIDVKGVDTPLSKFKRRFVKAQYGIEVELA